MPCLPTVDVGSLDVSCLRVHRFSRKKTGALLAMLAAVLPVVSHAAVTNYVWDGNAPFAIGNSRWSRASNWAATNTAPPANVISGLTNTDITFAGTLKRTPLMNNNYFIRTLTFANTAGAFTLTSQGAVRLSLGAGGIVNNSTNLQTILSSLSLSNSQTWNANAGSLLIGSTVNLGANTLTVAGGFNTTISNVISGSGALVKQGAGNLTLNGNAPNTYSGGTTISAGTLTAAKTNALGTGALVVNGGTLNFGAFNQTVGAISLLSGTISGTSGILTGTSFQFQSGNINMRLGGTAVLNKTGPGTVAITTSNIFSGGTTITGGKLLVNNTAGSGTGSGNVSVSSGGLLAGTGSLSGIVTNRPGGTISAGNEIGSLTIGGGVWQGGSTNRWDLSNVTGAAGTGWDLLNINGVLNITATSSNKAFFDISSFTLGGVPGAAANFNPLQSYLWQAIATTGGITFAPGESELTAFDLLTGNFINPLTGGKFGLALSPDGRSLNVTFVPASVVVPEPDRWALMFLTACGVIYGRRFKQNWGPTGR